MQRHIGHDEWHERHFQEQANWRSKQCRWKYWDLEEYRREEERVITQKQFCRMDSRHSSNVLIYSTIYIIIYLYSSSLNWRLLSAFHIFPFLIIREGRFCIQLWFKFKITKPYQWSQRSRRVCWPAWHVGNLSYCSPAVLPDLCWRPQQLLIHSPRCRHPFYCHALQLDSALNPNILSVLNKCI